MRAIDGSVWPEGGGVLLRLAPNEYIVAGSGIVIKFEKATENQAKVQALGEDGFAQAGGKGDKVISDGVISDKVMWKGERCGIGSVDEVKVNEDGTLSYIRRLNGDQDHQGRHVRISVGDFQILHVKLYEYK